MTQYSNIHVGATPPPTSAPGMAAQAQIFNQTIAQAANHAVQEQVAPVVQTLSEVMARVVQVEQALSIVAKEISKGIAPPSIFTPDEQRVFVFLQSGILTVEEARRCILQGTPSSSIREEMEKESPSKTSRKSKKAVIEEDAQDV